MGHMWNFECVPRTRHSSWEHYPNQQEHWNLYTPIPGRPLYAFSLEMSLVCDSKASPAQRHSVIVSICFGQLSCSYLWRVLGRIILNREIRFWATFPKSSVEHCSRDAICSRLLPVFLLPSNSPYTAVHQKFRWMLSAITSTSPSTSRFTGWDLHKN